MSYDREFEVQLQADIVVGIAREASDGVIEYNCTRCDEWKTGFEFMSDDPLICDLCFEENNVSS